MSRDVRRMLRLTIRPSPNKKEERRMGKKKERKKKKTEDKKRIKHREHSRKTQLYLFKLQHTVN